MEAFHACDNAPSSHVLRSFSPSIPALKGSFARYFLIAACVFLAPVSASAGVVANAAVHEGKTMSADRVPAAVRPHREKVGDEVPLLFLGIMGLGALALSHTRPSSNVAGPMRESYAGKNGASRKELPENAEPRSA